MRLILADHHPQTRQAIQALLEGKPEFDLVGEAETALNLLALAAGCPADLILLDRQLPGLQLTELIARLHALTPPATVMVMTDEAAYGRMILRSGADAFVTAPGEPGWLLEILHKYAHQVRMRDPTHLKD
jgi:two-component system invasion response regulator UvrY